MTHDKYIVFTTTFIHLNLQILLLLLELHLNNLNKTKSIIIYYQVYTYK